MNNNDILRSLRYTFDFDDQQMINIFSSGGLIVSRSQVIDWLKKEDDPFLQTLYDPQLAAFLNGFIVLKRGKKDGEVPIAEKKINNNVVFRKLKIALNYHDTDIIEVLSLVEFKISKHEISAFFRNPSQPQFRLCKDQILRNFLHGLKLKLKE